MSNKYNRAVILARVSSKAQEDEGYSLDSQVKLLRGYCENKELSVERIFKIAETASKDQSRKTFHELLTYISKNRIYHLAVEKTDRLTRNMKDAVAIDDWLYKDEKRMLHAVKENLLLHKEARSDVKFMWNIHLAVAKKYTDNLREEAMKGWAEKLAQGWLPSVPPLGYKTITENGKRVHVPDPASMKTMQKLFSIYIKPNESIRTVTEQAFAMGLHTRNGRPVTLSQMHKTLQNPFYIGINHFNGADYPGKQTPIIRKEVFDAVQTKIHSGRPQRFVRHNVSLSGLTFCAMCGKQVTWQLQRGKYYGACQRRDPRCKERKYKYVREEIVQEVVVEQLNRLFCPSQQVMQWVIATINESITKDTDNRDEVLANTQTRINRLKAMDDSLYDDKLSGDITKEKYLQKHHQIQQEIETMERALDGFEDDLAERKRRGVYLLELSQRAGLYYKDKDEDEKRQVLLELFDTIVINNGEATVKMKRFLTGIAKASDETRSVLRTLKSSDRTTKNTPNNGGDEAAYAAVRSIWQGRQDLNLRHPVLETGALPTELLP